MAQSESSSDEEIVASTLKLISNMILYFGV